MQSPYRKPWPRDPVSPPDAFHRVVACAVAAFLASVAFSGCINGKLTPAAGDAIVSGAEAVNAAGCGFLVPLALSAVGLPASAESLVCAGEEHLVARALQSAIAKVTAAPSDGGADHVASAAAAMSTPAKVPLRYRGRLVGFVSPALARDAQAYCDAQAEGGAL